MSLLAFSGDATNVKIKETVDVEIDFSYVNSSTDKLITETLLDSDFALEAQNLSMGIRLIEIKYFYTFIPVNFTQSALNDFVKN